MSAVERKAYNRAAEAKAAYHEAKAAGEGLEAERRFLIWQDLERELARVRGCEEGELW